MMTKDGSVVHGGKFSPPASGERGKALPDRWSNMKMVASRPSGGPQESAVSSAGGVSKGVKIMLLVVLCLQNAIYTMLRRYSVGVINETWSASSVLMVGEVIKLVISAGATLRDSTGAGAGAKMQRLVRTSLPMAVPAVIFWLMNLLSYEALERIDASTFTVCSQMKILATAVFSVLLLGRTFHPRKWRALVLMVLGVTLVSTASHKSDGDEDHKTVNMQYVFGVLAALLQVVLSGFVGVFFEKVLKSKVGDLSVWDRNVQLAMYSIACYLPVTLREEGWLFSGWTRNAVILSILGSAGGLLVALIMKHLDALLKTFATSGAIIVTAIAGHVLLDDPLNIPIAIGAGCTVLSLLNYNESDAAASVAAGKPSASCQECARRKLEEEAKPRSPYNYLPAPKIGVTGYFGPEEGAGTGADDDTDKPLIGKDIP